jgi:hypothetical protein
MMPAMQACAEAGFAENNNPAITAVAIAAFFIVHPPMLPVTTIKHGR